MAYATTYSAPPSNWIRRVFGTLGALTSSLGRAIVINREMDTRLRQVEKLRAKSDAELDAMGLTRDRIVHHVFRDIYYI
jgi:hypothetical protein